MVFAFCIAKVYEDDGNAGIDAGSSVTALQNWIDYDLEKV